jgi:hypothetical protein
MSPQKKSKSPPHTGGSQLIEHFGTSFCSMDPGHPSFREPLNGEWLIGLYRESDGSMCPIPLLVDPKIDLLWDPSLRHHVKPPSFYLLLQHQPQIDGNTSHPLVLE